MVSVTEIHFKNFRTACHLKLAVSWNKTYWVFSAVGKPLYDDNEFADKRK